MGGLVSAREAHEPRGEVDAGLTSCGIVAGGLNLNNYQLDGLHALTELLAPGHTIPLVRYTGPAQAAQAAADITALVTEAQNTPQGRARIALAAALFNLPGWSRGQSRPAPRDYAAVDVSAAVGAGIGVVAAAPATAPGGHPVCDVLLEDGGAT